MRAKYFIASKSQKITHVSAFIEIRRILNDVPEGMEYFNSETGIYENTSSRYSIDLSELNEYSEAHLLIMASKGNEYVEDWLASAESIETEFSSRLGAEYKRSSNNPNDQAYLLHDDGQWHHSKMYKNYELNSNNLTDVIKLRNALHKVQECMQYENALEFTRRLFKVNGFDKGWVELKRLVEQADSDLIRFGSDGNAELTSYVTAYEVIEQYGGMESASKEYSAMRILRWVTPEISQLEHTFKVMDLFYEPAKCNKGKSPCKMYIMGHCRPICRQGGKQQGDGLR